MLRGRFGEMTHFLHRQFLRAKVPAMRIKLGHLRELPAGPILTRSRGVVKP